MLLAIIITEAEAQKKWTPTEIVMGATFVTMMWIDAGQTKEFTKHEGHQEGNPILGAHPSEGAINAYTALTSLSILTVSHFLPHKWRKVLLLGGIGVQTWAIAHNLSMGWSIQF